jgi:CRISPR system Cascade subunit CasA
MTFNLTTRPWLPCIMADGHAQELSLSDALIRAHEVRELFDESPLVTVALHRVLLAILHRNFGPANTDEWFELWRRGRWNEEKLAEYFTRWHERFDLFHAERPFYQVGEIADAGRQPVSILFQELATGNNTTLFDHTYEDAALALDPALAARGLLARQTFSVGFGKSLPFYFSDSPLIRGFSVLVAGDTLFETLALNLIRYDRDNPIAGSARREDLPAWEQDHPEPPRKEGTVPAGYLDYLTWQSRRIHLYAGGDPPVVRQCQLQQGFKLADPPLDPLKCYRKDPKRGYVAVSFREERALWRDSYALFQAAEESHKRPAIFNWLAQLASLSHGKSGCIKPAYRFNALGLATDEGKAASVTLWRQERLPLPLGYLEDGELLADLGLALAYAEDVGGELRGSAWTFAKVLLTPSEGTGLQPRREEIEPIARNLAPELRFWPALEPPFLYLMTNLPGLDANARDDELFRWRRRVRAAALEVLEDTVRDLNASTRELRAVAVAERAFRRNLRRALEAEETL